MKKLEGPKLFPRIKRFINGRFIYNPIITIESLKAWDHLIAEYTCYINEERGRCNSGNTRSLGRLIGMRSRFARFRACDRKELVRFGGLL